VTRRFITNGGQPDDIQKAFDFIPGLAASDLKA